MEPNTQVPQPEVMKGVEQEVAVALQDGLNALNVADPPAIFVPHFLSNPRHECTKARQSEVTGKGVSTATDTKEVYASGFGPAATGPRTGSKDVPEDLAPHYDPDAVAAIIYREGRCKKCKTLVRSEIGRVVSTSERPPMTGRVARD